MICQYELSIGHYSSIIISDLKWLFLSLPKFTIRMHWFKSLDVRMQCQCCTIAEYASRLDLFFLSFSPSLSFCTLLITTIVLMIISRILQHPTLSHCFLGYMNGRFMKGSGESLRVVHIMFHFNFIFNFIKIN